MPEKFATVSWRVTDILTLEGVREDVTETDVAEFLRKHEQELQEAMVARGWDTIENLLVQDGLLTAKERG